MYGFPVEHKQVFLNLIGNAVQAISRGSQRALTSKGWAMSETKAAILCVDDEKIPRTLRMMVLRKQGYELVEASSGQEAVETLAGSSFDLALTHQMVPGITSTALAKHVRANYPGMPVIIISGMNELPPDAELADHFISKIEGPEALFRGVADVLEKYQAAGAVQTPQNSSPQAS